MNPLIQPILDQIIIKKSFINNYPKPGVVFLNIDYLLNDPVSRKMVSDAVLSVINPLSFDLVAGIASRGYIFSGMIANHFANVGEQLIQKVKSKDDPHFIQINTKTEYSSDALQVLKNTVQKGKKYLLTDDLIATGGSIMTAIKLIRECGGLVDKVFVMTELLDFGAREQLKKEGVELVSLLQFSNQDLQKLLLIQDCYAESPSTSLSYKLSHYEKGEQILLQTNKTSSLTVHLASQSSVKKEAAQLALSGMFDPLSIELVEHDAKSGVNSQPFGYEETLRGANNRIESIKDRIDNLNTSILVSMENGLRYSTSDNCYYDFVQIIVKKGDKTVSYIQDCCLVPTEIVNAISRNKDNCFQETWGDVAKRMGLAKEANNPHQEACFGGISRSQHLFQTLCKALGTLKENMIEQTKSEIETKRLSFSTLFHITGQASYSLFALFQKALQYLVQALSQVFKQLIGQKEPEIERQQFNITRLVNLNHNKAKDNYAKKGILFAPSLESMTSKTINLYNQGCPVNAWNIPPEKVKRTNFKIFSTGDAFSILSPEVEVNGGNITIHVGVEHEHYSPLVLLQEALQLCRCTYEHGAREIIIALPEQFHPALYPNDFNLLLLDLFKASGANKVYFYDKNYQGNLDITTSKAIIPLTVSQHTVPKDYQLSKNDLAAYLHIANLHQANKTERNLDTQAMHFMRKNYLSRAWSKFARTETNLVEQLCDKNIPSKIDIPTLKAQPHVLLCCSANKALAEKIANDLRVHGESVKVYQIDGKAEKALIPEEAEICGSVVSIVQSTRPNPDNLDESQEYQINGASSYFFEAAMIARQAHLRGAKQINLINPYQFSARSDKAEDNPKGKTGAYVQQNALLLEAAGVNHVTTAECHDTHTMSGSYTGKNIRGSAVSALSVMSTRIAGEWLADPNRPLKGQLRLVTPDAGAAKRTKELTQQLQAILGKKLSESRILGDKQRDSHQDDSALINSLNSGDVGINAEDKYLITDDETATGNTLCQAILNLKKSGAKDISVIIVHNNMPLDWLLRQLCLAKFLYLGVNDLHFSDTQEMGTLAKNYEDLINGYALKAKLSPQEIEKQILTWFKENIAEHFSDKSNDYLKKEFEQFKSTFNQFKDRIKVHSLASEFAKQVRTMPYVATPILREPNKDTSNYTSKGSLLFFPSQAKKSRCERDLLENNETMAYKSGLGH